jgi:hypothetical protein
MHGTKTGLFTQSQGENQRASAESIAQVMAEIRAAYRQ